MLLQFALCIYYVNTKEQKGCEIQHKEIEFDNHYPVALTLITYNVTSLRSVTFAQLNTLQSLLMKMSIDSEEEDNALTAGPVSPDKGGRLK